MEETIDHFLLECRHYKAVRQKLKQTLRNLGIGTLTTRILLGGGDYQKQTQHLIIKEVAAFLVSMGCLETL
jgi:hypothetical protein